VTKLGSEWSSAVVARIAVGATTTAPIFKAITFGLGFQEATPMAKISQATLAAVIKQRVKVEQAQAKLKESEEKLTAALKAGTEVQAGVLTARLRDWERRNVSWKSVVERELGAEYAQRVFNGTKPDKYESLVVEIAGYRKFHVTN
jgi:hypothetical protein